MTWNCTKCNSIIDDSANSCPLCFKDQSFKGNFLTRKKKDYKSLSTVNIEKLDSVEDLEVIDEEGLTFSERMRKRPSREIADYHLLSLRRSRKSRYQKRISRTPFVGEVTNGSIRTSRPLFQGIRGK